MRALGQFFPWLGCLPVQRVWWRFLFSGHGLLPGVEIPSVPPVFLCGYGLSAEHWRSGCRAGASIVHSVTVSGW
jgi:hypothetical protein